MLKNLRSRAAPVLFAAAVALCAATACSTTELAKEEHRIHIERIDSEGATINRAYLSRDDAALILRGEIKRRPTDRGRIPGHLHITLIDLTGTPFKEADIGYMRSNTNSSFASFTAKLPVELAPGSTIIIKHYTSDTHDVYSAEPAWREVERK